MDLLRYMTGHNGPWICSNGLRLDLAHDWKTHFMATPPGCIPLFKGAKILAYFLQQLVAFVMHHLWDMSCHFLSASHYN